MTEEVRARTSEPVGMTLADLIVLVVGCALASALPARGNVEWLLSSPSLFALLEAADEILQRACVALAVVIMVRRVRYGGPCRPVQLLVLFCAMPILASAAYLWLGAGGWGPGTAYWRWGRSADILCLVAFVTFAMVRKWLSGWAVMAWLGLAALAFNAGDGYLLETFGELVTAAGLREDALIPLCISILIFLTGMMYGMPGALALLDRPRVGWTWADWIGAGAAVASSALMIWDGFCLVANQALSSHSRSSLALLLSTAATSLLLSLALCFWLAWRAKQGSRSLPEASEFASA